MRKKIHKFLRCVLRRLLGPSFFEHIMMWHHLGYWPDLQNPKSFNEKTAYMKLYQSDLVPALLVDKWAVRDWVAQKVGAQYLNQAFGVYSQVEDIDFSSLPDRFVIKATHGSAMHIIVRDKASMDIAQIQQTCRRFLSQAYGADSNEGWYARIPPRLIIEAFIDQPGRNNLPDDYRFFVFGGRMVFVEVDINRGSPQVSNTNLDRNWQVMPFIHHLPINPDIPRPACFDNMVQLAETLGEGFPFVRVDMYCPDGKHPVFGEMTFAHESGWGAFLPDKSHDFALGAHWDITAPWFRVDADS